MKIPEITESNSNAIEQVKACAIRLLARREHSRGELKQKLLLRHFPEDLINRVIEALELKGWQSDLRFVKAYVDQQIQRGFGELKIQFELKKRGISKDLILGVLPDDPGFWEQQLLKLWHSKFGLDTKRRPTTPAQQIRFFQSRGFTHQQIKFLKTVPLNPMVLTNEK